jgi:hypothetical protein
MGMLLWRDEVKWMIYETLFYSNSNVLMLQDENGMSHALLYQTLAFHSLPNICENILNACCCEMSFWVYYKGLLDDYLLTKS